MNSEFAGVIKFCPVCKGYEPGDPRWAEGTYPVCECPMPGVILSDDVTVTGCVTVEEFEVWAD